MCLTDYGLQLTELEVFHEIEVQFARERSNVPWLSPWLSPDHAKSSMTEL